ncbi:MAG: hypothetical protein ILA06_04560 [Bacteroidaceae bacterium]|jgi:predicted  nucleic acid-binding Zn-ribbon protein|nr:hypothetical protein [Bacteroidaceae bacterium]
MARERKDPQDLSIEDKLKNLYQLQTMLSEIDSIKTLRGELPLEVQDLEDEIEGLTTRIDKIQADIAGLQDEMARRRIGMQDNNANIERYTQQLDNVRNNREYENLTKEIEYLQLDNQLNEKKLREANSAIEAKQEEIRRCSDAVTERRDDLDVKKSELDEIISETRAEEEKLRERSKNLELTIEPRLLSAFKRIRKNSRNGLGIVYVQRDACGGCFNKIPPQRQLDIRMRKKIIVCEYCGRIMIDPELAGVQLNKPVEEKPKRRRRKAEKKADEKPAED